MQAYSVDYVALGANVDDVAVVTALTSIVLIGKTARLPLRLGFHRLLVVGGFTRAALALLRVCVFNGSGVAFEAVKPPGLLEVRR